MLGMDDKEENILAIIGPKIFFKSWFLSDLKMSNVSSLFSLHVISQEKILGHHLRKKNEEKKERKKMT